MDLHPILVHFPIAFLSLYAIFELISFRRLNQRSYWFYVKAILIMVGAVGALLANLTGESATHFAEGVAIIEAHEKFAQAALTFSIFLALVYLVAWFGLDKFQLYAWKLLSNRGAMIPLAIAMLALITITGGLGGAIVYGTSFDPFMKPIFQLLDV